MTDSERLELIEKLKDQREIVGKSREINPERLREAADALGSIICTDYECKHDVGIQIAGKYCTCLDCGNLVSKSDVGRVYKPKEETSTDKIRNLYLCSLLCTDVDSTIKVISDIYQLKLVNK